MRIANNHLLQFGNSPVIDFGSELVHAGNGQYDSWWQTFGTWL